MDQNKIDDSVIIRHTNYGFIELLMNLIVSLIIIKFRKFVIFCIDDQSYDYLLRKGYESNIVMVPFEWIGIKLSSNFQSFGQSNKIIL